jgi:mannose-1-phosphate guanylyltransferase/mannose-6-phosphate isomerase
MSKAQTYCLIMAGGKGTRLWPESTESRPKQYLSLVGNKSLLTQTLDRFDNVIDNEHRFIVTTDDQASLAQQCSQGKIHQQGFIYEPSGRNTAPCILLSLAGMEARGASDDDVIAVMPSDHVILNTQGFQDTFNQSVELCRATDSITTIGINPHFPHTGYGYIKKGDKLDGGFKVSSFVEKPDFDTAKQYLATGEYVWNAGMFMAKLGVFKREFAKHSPEIFSFYEQLKTYIDKPEELASVYSEVPKDSIDYAIMEKSETVTLVPASFDWNDLGSWEALEHVMEKNQDNTVVDAKATFFKDSKDNVVYAPDKFVSLVNVNDMVVVSNEQVVMVMPKDDAQRVREVVKHLKDEGITDLL